MKLVFKILGVLILLLLIVSKYEDYQRSKKNEFYKNLEHQLLNEVNSNLNKSIKECERKITFDESNICLPKIEGWKEVRTNDTCRPYIDNLEINSKILAYYVPNNIIDLSVLKNLNSTTNISFYVHESLIGFKFNQQIHNTIFDDFRNNAFTASSWEITKRKLQTKTIDKINKPLLIDSYTISDDAKTCATLMSSENGSTLQYRLAFINIIYFNERVYLLGYSMQIINDAEYDQQKRANKIIVNKFMNIN